MNPLSCPGSFDASADRGLRTPAPVARGHFMSTVRKPGRSAALLLLILLLPAAGCRKVPAAAKAPEARIETNRLTLATNATGSPAIQVEAAKPHQPTFIRMTGRLVWDEDVTVRVFSPVAGRVVAMPVSLGASVKAGELLAKIDSPDFGQAQADWRKALADLRLAERNRNRTRELLAHGAAAQKDVEAAENVFTDAESEKQRAEARWRLFGGQADNVDGLFALRAPIDGVVVERNLNPGQEVRPDQMLANVPQLAAQLFTLSAPSRLWLLVDAPEQDLALLRPGQSLHFHTRTYGEREFAGRVEIVGAALDPATRTVKVRGSVPNPGGLLKAEMYVEVDVAGPEAEGADVPAGAVFMRDGKYFAFVESGPATYERFEVELGPDRDGQVLVRRGISVGQRTVVSGGLLLQELLESGGKPD